MPFSMSLRLSALLSMPLADLLLRVRVCMQI